MNRCVLIFLLEILIEELKLCFLILVLGGESLPLLRSMVFLCLATFNNFMNHETETL